MIHDPYADVSDVHRPTSAQAEALDLLELNPDHAPTLRLSLAQWRHVDRVCAALAARDLRVQAERTPTIPFPRPARTDLAGAL